MNKLNRKHMLFLIFAALAALALFFVCSRADAQDYQAEDRVVRITYGYGSAERIHGTSRPEMPGSECAPGVPAVPASLTEHDGIGMSLAYFTSDEVSMEGGLWMPLGNPGAENLSMSATVNRHFGRWFIPMGLGYRGELDSMTGGAGGGYEYLFKNGTGLRLKATMDYIADSGADERWAWASQAGVGWRF